MIRRFSSLRTLACTGVLVLLVIAVCGLVPVPAMAQPVITGQFPPNGSLQAGACGPFGVRLQPGLLTDYEDALVVRGSATGLRLRGRTTVSATGDSLYFEPAVPFAPGEEVTVTLLGRLRSGGVPLGEGMAWRVRVRPNAEAMTDDLTAMSSSRLSLASWFTAGACDYLAGCWGDLDGDGDQEGVLLLTDSGTHRLVTVARAWYSPSQQYRWQVRPPAACSADNPVDMALIDLDGGHRKDLALLTFSGLQVWRNPGSEISPVGGLAQWIAFPSGFNGRALTVGDLNADGHEDLVVVSLFGLQSAVYLNDGAGGLVFHELRTTETTGTGTAKTLPWPSQVLVQDVDGDGRLDLIWNADYQESGRYPVRVALGTGDGGFAEAGILTETDAFAPALTFGRTLDPWDDAVSDPVVLVGVPAATAADNLCGYAYTGVWPAASVGCLPAPGLTTGHGPVALSHFLSDGQGDVYPELWYVDPVGGTLTARPLGAHLDSQTRDLNDTVQAVFTGDFDYDGDGDVIMMKADEPALSFLSTTGGIPHAFPGPAGVACGERVQFGTREILCASAQIPANIPYSNEGLLPARIESIDLDDPSGVFSIDEWPSDWFGNGCFGSVSTVYVPVNFAPTDTIQYDAELTVTVTWVGAAAGEDSTLTCTLALQGRGGIFGATDGPDGQNDAGPGDLVWTGAGYETGGGTLDLGLMPALAGVQVDSTVSLTNTGHFTLAVVPPVTPPEPWRITPAEAIQLAPGETHTWTVQALPHADLLPAGVDTLDIGADLAWTVQPLTPDHCLGARELIHSLRGRLLAVAPCLTPDPACGDGEVDPADLACAESDTLTLLEGEAFTYCLLTRDWVWPGAEPTLRIVDNPLPWLIVAGTDTDGAAPDLDLIQFWSDEVGAEGGTVTIEVRDARYQTIVRTFTLQIEVEPARPDLMVVDMLFAPQQDGDEIQQQHPFVVDVVVEAQRMAADGVGVELDGEACVCGVGPLEKVILNLAEGQRDTVRFVVTSCSESGDCGFTACIEPYEGLAGDFDPSNNCFFTGALVAANKSPQFEFFDLTLSPADPDLESCDTETPWNVIDGGLVETLGVREENSLTVSVRAFDLDDDPRRLELVAAPDFVSYVAENDTLLHVTVAPPEGVVTESVCEEFGALTLRIAEYGIAVPETSTIDVPIYVKWEGPDLAVALVNVPGSARMQEDIRFNGRVTCSGFASGPLSLDMWLTDPDGNRVAGRTASYQGLAAGGAATLPQVLYQVERAGEYCAHIEVVSGRDVNANNNYAEVCFDVSAGPFVVSPNVVTPNGDGHNDEIWFHFDNQTVAAPRLRIFELGGNKIWETSQLDSDLHLTWDGRDFHGRLVAPGTYIYVIYDGQTEFSTGTCGVIR